MNKDQTTIMLGITTYNRMELLKKMAESLYASDISKFNYAVYIFDDCSDQYGIKEIQNLFPERVHILRHDRNYGADYNMGFMYRKFLETDYDILFNCDSDLIFSRHWLQNGLKLLAYTDGILSLFNTPFHEIKNVEGELCVKDSVGNAGTLMRREAVETICKHIHEDDCYFALDYNWCNLFRAKGKKIYATRKSFVQHIGVDGFNSSGRRFDYGTGFEVDSILNGQIFNDILERMSLMGSKEVKSEGLYYLFPFDRVRKGSGVAVYGAGKVGQDYLRQIEITDYCNVVAVVDQAYMELENVQAPGILAEIDCDYIILAAHFSSVREDMKREILKMDDGFRAKMVDNVCYSLRSV